MEKSAQKRYHLITFYTPVINPLDYELCFSGVVGRIVEIGDDFYHIKAFFKTKDGVVNSFNMYVPYTNIAGMIEVNKDTDILEPEPKLEVVKEKNNVINLNNEAKE